MGNRAGWGACMAGLILPSAPLEYNTRDQANLRKALQEADQQNIKKRRDIYLVQGERLILKSPNGTTYALTVDNSGVLSTTAV